MVPSKKKKREVSNKILYRIFPIKNPNNAYKTSIIKVKSIDTWRDFVILTGVNPRYLPTRVTGATIPRTLVGTGVA